MSITTPRQLRRRATRLARGDMEAFEKYYNKLKLNHLFLDNSHLKLMVVDLKDCRTALYDWENKVIDLVTKYLEEGTRIAPRYRTDIYEIWLRYYP